jgi:hypothetical protein
LRKLTVFPFEEDRTVPKDRSVNPESNKPATSAEQTAGEQSTQDGLLKTRGNTQDRAEVNQQKTPQGQSRRG